MKNLISLDVFVQRLVLVEKSAGIAKPAGIQRKCKIDHIGNDTNNPEKVIKSAVQGQG